MWLKRLGIILAGSLFFVLALLLLFKIFYPSGLPKTETQTPSVQFQILYKKAQDTKGRTLLYEGRGLYDGIGTGLRDVVGGRLKIEYIVGAVDSSGLVPIPNTRDFYILLVDPQTGEDLTGNIRILGAERDDLRATKIAVEDLNESAEEAQSLVGFANLILKEDLEKIIRPGDAVAVEFYFARNNLVREDSVLDGQERRIIESIVLRRYGGLGQIRKELAGESSDSVEFLR